jgi:hypothetical protein
MGPGYKQIARHLGISVRTVEDHFAAMRARTGARTRGELIACAMAAGLLASPPDKPGGHPGVPPGRGGQPPAPAVLTGRSHRRPCGNSHPRP